MFCPSGSNTVAVTRVTPATVARRRVNRAQIHRLAELEILRGEERRLRRSAACSFPAPAAVPAATSIAKLSGSTQTVSVIDSGTYCGGSM